MRTPPSHTPGKLFRICLSAGKWAKVTPDSFTQLAEWLAKQYVVTGIVNSAPWDQAAKSFRYWDEGEGQGLEVN